MKLDTSITHLIVFLASLLAVVVFTVTGHEPSATAWGFIGALLGATGVGSIPAVSAIGGAFKSGPSSQGGYINVRLAFIVVGWCLLGCVALSACAGLRQASGTDPVATACVTASAAIKTLAIAKTYHTLSATQVKAVDNAVPTVLDVCANPTEPHPSEATVSAFLGVSAQLQSMAAPYKSLTPQP